MPKSAATPATTIHGHRGARGWLPENTLPSVEYALLQGAHGVEVDCCVTHDDHLVLHHDLQLNPWKTKDPSDAWLVNGVRIRHLNLRELQRYRVGERNPKFPSHIAEFPAQETYDYVRVPSLQELFQLLMFPPYRGATANLELKQNRHLKGNAAASHAHFIQLLLGELAAAHFPAERLLVQSFDHEMMRKLKRAQPHLKVGITCAKPCGNGELFHARQLGVDVVSCEHDCLTPQLVKKARQLGLEVCAWTVNDPTRLSHLTDWGVDIVTTDYPPKGCKNARALEPA